MRYIILLQLLGLTPVWCMSPITKDLLTPIAEYGEACGYESCPQTGQNVLNVHIVPNMHAELGYGRTFYQYYTGYDEFYDHSKDNMKYILDAVITALWAHAERKFTFSDMPYLFHWWRNRDMTVKRMVYELIRQGRLNFVGGGWSMTEESTTSYHAIIDSFTYSLRKINATFLDCGRPRVTWQSDVYGHSREFASLMAQMGFDGHFIHPISFEDELARMQSKSLEFLWRGSDDLGAGTDIYTHKLFDGYWPPPGFCFGGNCNDPLIITSDSVMSNVEERVNEFLTQMHQRQAPYYTTSNVMVVMGHFMGYHDAELWFTNIGKLIHRVNAGQASKTKKANLFYSTPACYLQAVHNEAPKLKTKQDDFTPFTYDKDSHSTGMYTSRPIIKYLAREIHLYVQLAKQLQIFGNLGNNDKKFEDIMWIQGVLQDHTILAGCTRPHVNEYFARKALVAKEICMQMYRPALNILRNSNKEMIYYTCQFNTSSCWTLLGDNFFIVIYNPLAWPVTLPVRLPVKRGIYSVVDPKGVQQNHSIVSVSDLVTSIPDRGDYPTQDELVFIAERLPPMGYRSYYVDRIQVRPKTGLRSKRSIIKKLNKNSKKTKYLARQTNNLKIDDKSLLDDIPGSPIEYEDFDETASTDKVGKELEFANGSKERELELYNDAFSPTSSKILVTDDEFRENGFNGSTTTISPLNSTTNEVVLGLDVMSTTTNPITTTMAVLHTLTPPIPTEKTPLYEYYDESTDLPSSTTPYVDMEKHYRRMEKNGYHSIETDDLFIKNEYIQINFNQKYKLTTIVLSNGVNITFDIQMCYYVADDPAKLGTIKVNPGAFMFRPMDPQPILIQDYHYEVKVIKSTIVEELQIKYSNYAGISLKLYRGLPTIEVDWTIGPIPIDDSLGKDVFIRYVTNLENKGVFYTDSNGRQTVKRIRDVRATYTPVRGDEMSSVASNFYPVTSKIYIEDLDKNIRFSVFTDRCQGGTSLLDGHLDLMIHRRLFTDDSGILVFLNETEFGKGLIVRGKHYLYVSKADYRPNKVFEKKFAKELELHPQVFTSIHPSYYDITFDEWKSNKNEYTALRMKLPIGVHVLTIEKWGEKLLLRLENYLEKSDIVRNGLKTVFLKDLFMDFRILDARETTLGANIWLEDHVPLNWQHDEFVKNFNDIYGSNFSKIEFSDDSITKQFEPININNGIDLLPQQIRTFVVSYVRV